MSLKITYVNWLYVAKIFPIRYKLIFLFGVLRRAAIVSRVKPLFSLRRQMKSFSLDEKSAFGPVLAFSVVGQSLLFQ